MWDLSYSLETVRCICLFGLSVLFCCICLFVLFLLHLFVCLVLLHSFVCLTHFVWSHPLETGAGTGEEEGRGNWTKPKI